MAVERGRGTQLATCRLPTRPPRGMVLARTALDLEMVSPRLETVERASVLIVEDDREYVEFLTAVCKEHGLVSAPATSIADASRELERRPYDVLVVDLHMGRGDGVELIRRVRSRWPEMAVIGMAAGMRIPGVGACDYLLKPFHCEELILRITRVASSRR